jgi:Transmembrane domain of unknown function (DUF3566)
MAVRGGVGVDHHVEPQPSLSEGATAAVTEEATVASGQADAEADAASEQVSLNGTHDDTERQLTHDPAPLPSEVGALNGSQGSAAADPDRDPDSEVGGGSEADASLGAGEGSEAHASSEAGEDPEAQAEPEAEADPEAGADPISYSQDGTFSYEQASSDDYQQEASYTTDYPAAQSGYNDGMNQSMHNDGLSPPVGGESQVPPYPAELRHGEPATVTTQPELAAVATAATAPAPKARPKISKRPKVSKTSQGRRANLVITRLEPWSVMKFSFLMSLVAWVVLFVAVTLLYYALSGLGVFATIQRTLSSVTSSQNSSGVNLAAWTSASRVLGYTMLAGAVDIVLITVLATIGAVIYNLVTHLGGGIEVTLKETD